MSQVKSFDSNPDAAAQVGNDLAADQDPLTIPINRAYPRRLTAQWSNQAFSSRFRVPLNLNGRQLSMVERTKRLNFVLTEKLFGNPSALWRPSTNVQSVLVCHPRLADNPTRR